MDNENQQWTREECCNRYVYGDKIGLRELAKISGRALGTLGQWSGLDDWIERRERYLDTLRSTVERKIIDKTSEHLANELVEMNLEHIKGSDLFRKLSQQFTGIIAAEIQKTPVDKRFAKVTDKETTLALQRYSGIFSSNVNLQRQAMGMKHLDDEVAVNRVIQLGYDVYKDDGEEMEQL